MPKATPDGMKVCSRCLINQDVSNFVKNRRAKDGLFCHCNRCKYEYKKEWRAKGSDAVQRDKKATNERSRKWRQANTGRAKENGYKWAADNREQSRAIKRKWWSAQPEYGAAHMRKVRARKAELPNLPYTVEDIVNRDGIRCALTGTALDIATRSSFHVDHLTPILVDMTWYNSIQPYAPHPGDQLGNVRLADPSANTGRSNKMTLLDHCDLQAAMPCWFTRAAIEQHYKELETA